MTNFAPNFTVLVPCVEPKFEPVIVTCAPTAPVVGEMFVMLGVGRTLKVRPLLSTPLVWTSTLPVEAPVGTGITMEVALQVPPGASVPPKETVLAPRVDPKFAPAIVTDVDIGPDAGEMVDMLGAGTTVNALPTLEIPPTVTTTFPVVAPAGTVADIEVVVQPVTVVASTPLNVTVLVPWGLPKFDPVIAITAPAAAVDGDRVEMTGAAANA